MPDRRHGFAEWAIDHSLLGIVLVSSDVVDQPMAAAAGYPAAKAATGAAARVLALREAQFGILTNVVRPPHLHARRRRQRHRVSRVGRQRARQRRDHLRGRRTAPDPRLGHVAHPVLTKRLASTMRRKMKCLRWARSRDESLLTGLRCLPGSCRCAQRAPSRLRSWRSNWMRWAGARGVGGPVHGLDPSRDVALSVAG